MNPPILPWHLTVGAFAADRTRAAVAGLEPSKTSARDFAALVAEHDPAAQREETVRLLERALDLCAIGDERLFRDIGRHLATLRGEKGTST